METAPYTTGDMIVALATPWGKSALATIRTSGSGSIEAVASLFSRGSALLSSKGGMTLVGTLTDAETGLPMDEVVLCVFRAPASYTGEDSVEISCHGNQHGIARILRALRGTGFRDAGPGEFTLRAFLNGRIDLTMAEAVHEVVTANTETAHSLALNRLSGAVADMIGAARADLLALSSAVELELDYPEDELPENRARLVETAERTRSTLAALGDTYRVGRIYRDGVRVAIAGRTNAGKSSLFNLLVREERSIVSAFHGTTRDYIESWLSLSGIPFLFYDTAGLRDSSDALESEGIRRSERVIASADIVLYVIDGTVGFSEGEEERIAGYRATRPCILAVNKADLCACEEPGPRARTQRLAEEGRSGLPADHLPSSSVRVSALTGEGLAELQRLLVAAAAGGDIQTGTEVVIDSERQKGLIDRAVSALDLFCGGLREGTPLDAAALDLREALQALGEITGEVTTDDILSAMFGRFCVGK